MRRQRRTSSPGRPWAMHDLDAKRVRARWAGDLCQCGKTRADHTDAGGSTRVVPRGCSGYSYVGAAS